MAFVLVIESIVVTVVRIINENHLVLLSISRLAKCSLPCRMGAYLLAFFSEKAPGSSVVGIPIPILVPIPIATLVASRPAFSVPACPHPAVERGCSYAIRSCSALLRVLLLVAHFGSSKEINLGEAETYIIKHRNVGSRESSNTNMNGTRRKGGNDASTSARPHARKTLTIIKHTLLTSLPLPPLVTTAVTIANAIAIAIAVAAAAGPATAFGLFLREAPL
mmetsp:Transcript_3543/g.9289  ORF Transcript_3543/g.9289 Transcript_3543/m.9289 type:complete len:221 (+) Transcript_3543:2515-3177(+)